MTDKKLMRYTLTMSGVGYAKGVLCITISLGGKRKSLQVAGVEYSDGKYWDKTSQRFKKGTRAAKTNNPVLDKVCKACDALINDKDIQSIDDFIEAYRVGGSPKTLTYGNFLRSVINNLKNNNFNQLPSKNYQKFITLFHKLEREGKVINVPIQKVTDTHFKSFGNWVSTLSVEEGLRNYTTLMKTFKQVMNLAYDDHLTDNVLRFKYERHAPVRPSHEKQSPLSKAQYRQFCSLDVSKIRSTGPNWKFLNELYKDFCIFLYESKSRPVDVIGIKESDIKVKNGKKYWAYIPEKKKNSRSTKTVYAPLNEKALSIIEKYRGQSKEGYAFPFAMNNRVWDKTDTQSWNKWSRNKDATCQGINRWLKKVQETLGIGFNLILYTFRTSALTHACGEDDRNLLRIALEAGTSVEMLEKHYVSNFGFDD